MAQTSSIFKNEKIRPELQAGLEKINFTKPTKVQSSVIPALLNKKNVKEVNIKDKEVIMVNGEKCPISTRRIKGLKEI